MFGVVLSLFQSLSCTIKAVPSAYETILQFERTFKHKLLVYKRKRENYGPCHGTPTDWSCHRPLPKHVNLALILTECISMIPETRQFSNNIVMPVANCENYQFKLILCQTLRQLAATSSN